MADAKITQEFVEVFTPGNPPVNLTQEFAEVFILGNPPVKTTQAEVEVWLGGGPPSRMTQVYVEVWYTPDLLSGLYFINPNKADHKDTYNHRDRKIPDPTIRTAYIGS